MFLDGRKLECNCQLTVDLCIVGAGAAGLTLAQALDGGSRTVLLIDSGGVGRDTRAQMLNAGSANDIDYPFMQSRARRFGGTTSRWTGVCIALDAADFARRDWLPHSGWPIDLAELAPYYNRARPIFGLPAAQLDPPLAGSPFQRPPLTTKTLLYSNPRDLGRKYRRQIARSDTVICLLHATVSELHLDDDRRRVERLDVRCLGGNRFGVRARTVVLATGGIENARLLLASNAQIVAGIGNQFDNVGRYFMEHPLPVVGLLDVGSRRADMRFFTNFSKVNGAKALETFGLSPQLRQQAQLLDMHLRGYRYSRFEERAAIVQAKTLPLLLRKRQLRSAWQTTAALGGSWRKELLPYLRWHFWNKLHESARFDVMRLNAVAEQEPNPSNRITLSAERDAFGRPLPHLAYRVSDMTRDSMRRSLQILDDALQAGGCGRLRYGSAVDHLTHYNQYGLHHMGSTRMHSDPRHGVVDADCRVHGVANLYIVGSSVFTTGGAANPTLTIAALALRLADRLRQKG